VNQYRNPQSKQVGKLILSPSQYYDPTDQKSNPFFGKSGDLFAATAGHKDSHTTRCWLNPKDDADMTRWGDWLEWGMKNVKSITVGIYEPTDPTRQSQPSQYEPSGDFQPATKTDENKRAW
jgi:hypothetical protein